MRTIWRWIRSVDESVGKVFITSKENGLEENTLVLYLRSKDFISGSMAGLTSDLCTKESFFVLATVDVLARSHSRCSKLQMPWYPILDLPQSFLSRSQKLPIRENHADLSLLPDHERGTTNRLAKKSLSCLLRISGRHSVQKHEGALMDDSRLSFLRFDEWNSMIFKRP